jgi:coenzyme F420-0:L-glutamate ligase
VITIFAPDRIGEVVEGTDLAPMLLDAVAADPHGPLRPGDVVVITSKIISKAEGRRRPEAQRSAAIAEETRDTVAWRSSMRIVRSRLGLVQAAAGVDASNVAPGEILLLPADPDATARALRDALTEAAGGPVGVVVSDTAGRAWRVGQTDHAIGAAGVVVRRSYAGQVDAYGNELQVTVTAIADELAAAADLAKGKLHGRPVAVIRGLDDDVISPPDGSRGATQLNRPPEEDMFARGSREAVVSAVLHAAGRSDAYEDLVGLEGSSLLQAVLGLCPESDREALARVLGWAIAAAGDE